MDQKISQLHLIWILPIAIFSLFIKFSTINTHLLPIENAFIAQAYKYQDNNIIDKYSANFIPLIIKKLNFTNNNFYFKIISCLISFLQLYFLYKFSKTLFNSNETALLSIFLALLQAPLIFISQLATNDIIALTIFTLFLWHFAYLHNLKKYNNFLWILIISMEFSVIIVLNYILIFLLPLVLFIIYRHSKKFALIFLIINLLLISIYLIYYFNMFSIQILQIYDTFNLVDIKFYKIPIRIAELIVLPLMLFYAAYQFQWKSSYKKEFYYVFLASSMIIPTIAFLLMDVYNFYRLMIFPITILLPINAYVLRQFLTMNIHYKYSVIFISLFMFLFSYWTLSKFQDSYPNTDNLIKFVQKNISINQKIYSEDKFFLDANLPSFTYKKSYNCYYLTSQNNDIINKCISGYFDVIILNGLIHKNLTEKLRDKYLKIYRTIFSEEFVTNSMLLPENEGILEIYISKNFSNYDYNFLTIIK